jgi:replicative DNA helicase
MIGEMELFRVLQTRDEYLKYRDHIDAYALSDYGDHLLRLIDAWYSQSPTPDKIDWRELATYMHLNLRRTFTPDIIAILDTLLEQLSSTSGSSAALTASVVEHFRKRSMLHKMAATVQGLLGSDPSVDDKDVEAAVRDYIHYLEGSTSTSTAESGFISLTSLEDMDRVITSAGGLDWRLDDLNRSVGPLRRGDFILLGARPETGKTSFVCDQLTYFAKQVPENERLFIFNNEEDGMKIMSRLVQTALSKSASEVAAMPVADKEAQYKTAINATSLIKIGIYDDTDITINDVERVCSTLHPRVIVLNVIDEIKGFDKTLNEVERLTKLGAWCRHVAKKYNTTVIGIVQADTTAEGQKWIHQGQLYGSKTKLPSAADVIITIGKTHDVSENDVRFLHLPKNKMPTIKGMDKRLKHGYFHVDFDSETGRFSSRKGGAGATVPSMTTTKGRA